MPRRRNADRLVWIAVTDELLTSLRILNGHDADLAIDANRITNRLRDSHVAVSQALDVPSGAGPGKPGSVTF